MSGFESDCIHRDTFCHARRRLATALGSSSSAVKSSVADLGETLTPSRTSRTVRREVLRDRAIAQIAHPSRSRRWISLYRLTVIVRVISRSSLRLCFSWMLFVQTYGARWVQCEEIKRASAKWKSNEDGSGGLDDSE